VYPPSAVGKALVVDQEWQVLRVYEDGREVRTLPASTGQAPYYTPAFTGRVRYYVGTFYSYSFGVWADDAWYVFMGAGEIMIHGLPYTKSGDEKIYEGAEHLGVRPSSHGCIRLHPDDAAWLTAWNPGGVPIVITPPVLDKEW
jgi:lipoprotein-anchoring transpeptidase ErfK/SrfK